MALFTESFNKADSTVLGPDLTWAEVVGNMVVNTNRVGPGAAAADAHARAEHDAATVAHYTELTLETITEGSGMAVGGPMVRYAAAADTAYCFQARRSAAADDYSLARWNAGVETFPLGTLIAQAPAAGDRLRLEVETLDVNTVRLRAYVNEILVRTFDDTSASRITTGTRGGIRGIVTGTGVLWQDDFEFGDLAATPTPTPTFLTLGVGA